MAKYIVYYSISFCVEADDEEAAVDLASKELSESGGPKPWELEFMDVRED